jgi:hypothetical protein
MLEMIRSLGAGKADKTGKITTNGSSCAALSRDAIDHRLMREVFEPHRLTE